jgi:hypothetical protein
MESMSDIILSPALKVSLKGKGINGYTLTIKPSAVYNLYVKNTEKSYAELGLDIKQNLGSKRYVGLEIYYASSVFSKNYLSDAVDSNVDGSISSDEKRYTASSHDSFTVAGTYGMRLSKGKTGRPGALGVRTVDGEFLLGYQQKEYDAPFSNRSEDGYMLGASVEMDVDGTVGLTLGYLFETINTPVSTEVLIRNEQAFNFDYDGVGGITNTDEKTVQNVDRSRTEHTFSAKAVTDIGNGWNGYARYALRFQNYSSTETHDVTRLGRNDVRHRIGFGADKKLDGEWSCGLGYRWTEEKAGRDALAGTDMAESKSYSKHELSATVVYAF